MNPLDQFDLESRLEIVREILPEDLQNPLVLSSLQISLEEDLFPGGWGKLTNQPFLNDLTSAATLPTNRNLSGRIFVKSPGVIAGLPVAEAVFKFVDPRCEFINLSIDGAHVETGASLATLNGPGIGLLAAERTALNFLGRLSGIASQTRKFVDAIAPTDAVILDTRKTAPGFRYLDKYAVRMGGGENHRFGLYDMVLIKNNHWWYKTSHRVSQAML